MPEQQTVSNRKAGVRAARRHQSMAQCCCSCTASPCLSTPSIRHRWNPQAWPAGAAQRHRQRQRPSQACSPKRVVAPRPLLLPCGRQGVGLTPASVPVSMNALVNASGVSRPCHRQCLPPLAALTPKHTLSACCLTAAQPVHHTWRDVVVGYVNQPRMLAVVVATKEVSLCRVRAQGRHRDS